MVHNYYVYTQIIFEIGHNPFMKHPKYKNGYLRNLTEIDRAMKAGSSLKAAVVRTGTTLPTNLKYWILKEKKEVHWWDITLRANTNDLFTSQILHL